MIKTQVPDIMYATFSIRLLPIVKKFIKVMTNFGSICILSEDTIYNWHFKRVFMPALYKQHTSELYANCIFCSNLVRSGCHKHCLKCSVGTYIHCSPLLPGVLYCETNYPYNSDYLAIPWYYRETCSGFKRLPQSKYFRNLHVFLSSIGIYNFEVLEGLEKGLSAGEKPCHVCASIDYELYRKCSGQGDFDVHTPCHRISTELNVIYKQADL